MDKPVYAITALRWEAGLVTDAMMGLIDLPRMHWELAPAPTRLTTVIDHLLDGDVVLTLWQGPEGGWHAGPGLQMDVSQHGIEQLAMVVEHPGQRLRDLPRF